MASPHHIISYFYWPPCLSSSSLLWACTSFPQKQSYFHLCLRPGFLELWAKTLFPGLQPFQPTLSGATVSRGKIWLPFIKVFKSNERPPPRLSTHDGFSQPGL